jgi:hypothetical protein
VLAVLSLLLLFIPRQVLGADLPVLSSGTHRLPRPVISPQALPKQVVARPFVVGDTLTVPAYSFRLGDQGHYKTTTTCRVVGSRCYLFVEDEIWGSHRITQAGLESLVDAFDRSTPADSSRGIYWVTTNLFGPPPDADADPRILIVVLDILDSPITGTAFVGYFDVANQAPPTSREVIYIDSNPLDIDSDLARATLAHEFQHMLHWRGDPDEDKWVDEGCSEYAELACGYKDTTRTAASAFLQVTNTSLTLWEDLPFDFDQAYLWMTYFVQRYGEGALPALVSTPEDGIQGVDLVLEGIGSDDRYADLFADWMAATFLDGPGPLGYDRIDLGSVHTDTLAVPTEVVVRRVRLWGIDYLALGESAGVTATLSGALGSGLMVSLITQGNGEASAGSASIPAGVQGRISAFGPGARVLAVTRTSGDLEDYTISIAQLDGTSARASDFDNSGRVDFEDFVRFARNFGRTHLSNGFDPSYDLDGDGRIAFPDFVIFARNFGSSV